MKCLRVGSSCLVFALALAFAFPGVASAFQVKTMQPNYHRYQVFTDEPLTLVCDQALDPSTVGPGVILIQDLKTNQSVTGTVSLATTNATNDTLILTPSGGHFPWAERLQVQISAAVHDLTGASFTGSLPYLGVFVANIPNDLQRPEPSSGFPVNVFVNSNVLLGFNPLDPEGTDPTKYNYIPGMAGTEAWKMNTGDPNVLIAVVDDGIGDYANPELLDRYFLNKGELPQPQNAQGVPCPNWDCNGDGRFSASDYINDPRVYDANGNGVIDAGDLIIIFSDGIDNDHNGFIDDICGWDFFRNVNTPFGVTQFKEGTHGEQRIEDVVDVANNGIGDKPGFCPNCSILPVRVGEAIMTEYNLMAQGVKYATEMGAEVICVANGVDDYSVETEQTFIDAYDAGALIIAASGDELGMHHIFPAAGEDAYCVKGVLPIPPVELFGPVNLSVLAFVESYCTNFGAHIDATGATGACSSEATSDITGIAGLIHSYARQLGITLSPGEVRQLLNMTADPISANCFTWNLEGCKPGWNENFGYGRVNAHSALEAMGDPLFGVPERIPPDVRITSPHWWTTIDPSQTPTFDVEGYVYARGRPFTYQLEIGFGVAPAESDYVVVQTGSGQQPLNGKLATVDVMKYVNNAWLTRTPKATNDFTVILRLKAWWSPSSTEQVVGQIRKEIGWHIDHDPTTGLLPGFPKVIGASGASSPLMYDMDGDPDGRLEIVFATALPTVEMYKYDDQTGEYRPAPGFPVALPRAPGKAFDDSVIASVAVGPVFGDGIPYIAVATSQALVYLVYPDGNNHAGGPFVPGFPVSANPKDNSTPLSWGHGNGFAASPVLADLEGDGFLDIVIPSFDQHIYAWRPTVGANGLAEPVPGWPVLLSSAASDHLVNPSLVCDEEGPAEVLGTPAIAILDPSSSNPDIAYHPSVIVGTSETCSNSQLPTGRLYAVYWNGMNNANGPFLPDWPAIITTPSGNSLPIPPLTIGVTSSPAIAWDSGVPVISTGSFFWFPQLVFYQDEKVYVRALWSDVNLGDAANGSFGRFDDSGILWYFFPTAGFLQNTDTGFRLIAFSIVGWRLDNLKAPMFRKKLDDINFFLNPIITSLRNTSLRQIVSGSGGYLIHAVDMNDLEADGFPKYTQNWSTSSPAVGDLMGNGTMDIVATTHEGNLFAWKTKGNSCLNNEQNAEWGRFHHDTYNTGVYGYDAFPPRMVRNLKAYKTESANVFSLYFTAPGDDGDCGRPASWDIRYSTKPGENLRDPAVWATAAVAPAPDPAMGGTKVVAQMDAPGAVSFAMRAYDKMGLMSWISNQAIVQDAPPPDDDSAADDDESPTPFADDDTSPAPNSSSSSKKGGCGC
jgi:hypothetical protein